MGLDFIGCAAEGWVQQASSDKGVERLERGVPYGASNTTRLPMARG